MTNSTDPKSFGLTRRTLLENIGFDTMAIVINRKSRIIMADARRIVAHAEKIKQTKPQLKVVLKTAAPVCSKTLRYLAENHIGIIHV